MWPENSRAIVIVKVDLLHVRLFEQTKVWCLHLPLRGTVSSASVLRELLRIFPLLTSTLVLLKLSVFTFLCK